MVIFNLHDDAASKVEQLDLICHIAKKLLHATKHTPSSYAPSATFPPTPSSSSFISSSAPPSSPTPSPSSTPHDSTLSSAPPSPRGTLAQELEEFPSQEIWQLAEYIATQIMTNRENLGLWFEDAVMALALFCGISTRANNDDLHRRILALSFSIYSQEIKNMRHNTPEERQYNMFLIQVTLSCLYFVYIFIGS
jgi:hypothetical protein